MYIVHYDLLNVRNIVKLQDTLQDKHMNGKNNNKLKPL